MSIELDDARTLALTGARRIAVVGASDDPERHSNDVMRFLLDAGYEVEPVNPSVSEVLGRRSWPDLASVPGRVDVVDVFRSEEHLPGIAEAAVARDDVAVVWNQLGLRSDAARQVVLAAGRGYVEDHCLMVEVDGGPGAPPRGPRLEHPWVLLDLDDTVLDHDACERGAVAATLAAHGLDDGDGAIDTYARINARLWEEYRSGRLDPVSLRTDRWRETLAAIGATADVGAISADYLDRFAATGALLPGAAEAVWWLSRRSGVAVVTNGFADVQRRRLAATGIEDLVHAFASSEEAGVAKPDPTPLRLGLERLGAGDVDPADVAVVGDQLATDVRGGQALGAHTVWVAPEDAVVPAGVTPPDVHVAALADIA